MPDRASGLVTAVLPGTVHGYEYDVFVSYRRNGNVRDWVRNHFAPRLYACLADEMADEPRIFLDDQIEAGTSWPDKLAGALRRSHLMVAVWTPSYFTSRWCLAEWHTMRRREHLLGMGGSANPTGLIYPIRYSDGDRFPPEAQNVQQEMVFKRWGLPYPQFAESLEYLEFHRAVVELAERLVTRFDAPPPWQPDWPIERPEPPDPGRAELPRL